MTGNDKAQTCPTSRNATRRYQAFLKFLPIPLLVHNLDHSVAYMNPAFEETFGWSMTDLDADPFAPTPADQIKTTYTGKVSLLTNGVFYGLETQRLTKDGRMLDVIYDGSALYDPDGRPDGLVVTLRDITQAKKDARTTRALFEIGNALHRYRDLDRCLKFVTQRVQDLVDARLAYIVLIDTDNHACYFNAGAASGESPADAAGRVRVRLDDSIAGRIVATAAPVMVNRMDDSDSLRGWPFDTPAAIPKNLIGVPMQVEGRTIGVIIAADRIGGDFDDDDLSALSSIAGMVALPIENTRINAELRRSYDAINVLNQAKDRLIERLSHELRTPISVLSATLTLLQDGDALDPAARQRIVDRSQRNLQRIVDMQARLKDIIDRPEASSAAPLSGLLSLCLDEIEAAADVEGGAGLGMRIRRRIADFFDPPSRVVEALDLAVFTTRAMEMLTPQFAHRRIAVRTEIQANAGIVMLPADVLAIVIRGLVRNAVEYTPDGGQVTVAVRSGKTGPVLSVADTGIGITPENQRLIAGSYFTTADMYRYTTGTPFDFNAGGRGLDILRMHVFAQRYGFRISIESRRCVHLPTEAAYCPGNTAACTHCVTPDDCHQTGGTTVVVRFPEGSGEETLRASKDT